MQSFSELSISPSLKERLIAARFSTPTPVQAAAIPQALEGKDLIATAQTGTAKTLAFLIPVMEKLSAQEAAGIAALVLVPTRELAMQVAAQHDALRSKQTSGRCEDTGAGRGRSNAGYGISTCDTTDCVSSTPRTPDSLFFRNNGRGNSPVGEGLHEKPSSPFIWFNAATLGKRAAAGN